MGGNGGRQFFLEQKRKVFKRSNGEGLVTRSLMNREENDWKFRLDYA